METIGTNVSITVDGKPIPSHKEWLAKAITMAGKFGESAWKKAWQMVVVNISIKKRNVKRASVKCHLANYLPAKFANDRVKSPVNNKRKAARMRKIALNS